MNKIYIGIIAVLVAISATLGILYFNSSISLKEKNKEIDELKIEITSINTVLKNNDAIANQTINSLNKSLTSCQEKQNEMIDFCDKRVKLALESHEVDVAIEEVTSSDSTTVKGIDGQSSMNYLDELNKIIYGFGK